MKQVGAEMEGVEEMGQVEGEVDWAQERVRRAQEQARVVRAQV